MFLPTISCKKTLTRLGDRAWDTWLKVVDDHSRPASEILLEILALVDRLHNDKTYYGRTTKDLANLRLTCRLLAIAAAVALLYRVSETRWRSVYPWMGQWRLIELMMNM